jgi:CheY-like chemotaxis protein
MVALVTTVTSGAAALESANNEDFELIISDVSMPEIDGLEMIRRLKRIRDIRKFLRSL